MKHLLSILLMMCLALPVYAQGKSGKGMGSSPETFQNETAREQGRDIDKTGDRETRHASKSFSDNDRELISRYFRDQQKKHPSENKNLPPGLAKKDQLPPGMAKQLERNGTLPPGIEQRDLPGDLERLLPPIGSGQRRMIVNNEVVLMDEKTGLILDIIRDIGILSGY